MEEIVYGISIALIVIAAIILILMVLVQKSKGAGLASGFASSNQIMGVRKTTDFVEKATWGLAGTIIVLSLVSTLVLRDVAYGPKDSSGNIETQTTPVSTPDVTTPLPSIPTAPTAPQE